MLWRTGVRPSTFCDHDSQLTTTEILNFKDTELFRISNFEKYLIVVADWADRACCFDVFMRQRFCSPNENFLDHFGLEELDVELSLLAGDRYKR